MVDHTGWTLPAIYALTMEEVDDLFRHWSEEPPLVTVARELAGWTPPTLAEPEIRELTPEQWERMKAGVMQTAEEFGRAR